MPVVIGAAVGLALTSTLVLRTTQAVFSGTTASPSNSWATGSVTLTNTSSGSAAFAETNLTTGQVIDRCIAVTYTGTNTATAVKLYSSASGTLAANLNLTVEIGTGSVAGASCANFTGGTQIYTGTVSGLASTTGNAWTNGVGGTNWTSVAQNATRTYKFHVTVDNAAAQGQTAASVFTWEAQG